MSLRHKRWNKCNNRVPYLLLQKKIGQANRPVRADRPLLPSGPGGVKSVITARGLTRYKNRSFFVIAQSFLCRMQEMSLFL